MNTPDKILELVKTFDLHRDSYMSPTYNETQVRRQFIDPMFAALGWDIDNKAGYAEQYRQVVHEDSLKVGDTARAPDYSFRLGGRRLFFVEAKKPAINLKEDPSPAYQLRRYAWTAKLPVSILTDFEEFIVYDTRVRPEQNDKASKARVLHIPYSDYPKRWHEIADLFSPEAIQKGALDKYVQSTSKKRGTAEVDDAFLAEIEEWRELLAKNIALRNSGLSQRDMNFAVQITIDRIVFLRICEDRRIESFAQLMALLSGDHVYDRLRVLFERADERYNSGLFHFHKEKDRSATPDTLTPKLAIDDKVLKTIIRRLYYPDCPYEFSVFPPEILGQVYERFLGSVIRLTSGHQAKIEQKPEVRKAGGVYYTPSYIVDYIVKHTVGKLLEGKTPQQVGGLTEAWRPSKTARPLAVLDPACGSGSFLLGAYQHLLDWHLDQYTKEPDAHSKGKEPRLYQHHRGGWRLTTNERKRILLANIYGVDIDSQAVEVTKLSLLLKVLEGVDAEVLQRQLSLFHERALPDLDNNIKCGNSLIGRDFYKGKQGTFDEEEEYRINAFDWDKEFAAIMKSGGFDAVIGNPPYVRQESLGEMKDYFEKRFAAFSGTADLYVYFVEKGTSLLRENGMFAYIVSSSFLRTTFAEKLRTLLQNTAAVLRIIDFGGLAVFQSAKDTYVCIPVLSRRSQPSAIEVTKILELSKSESLEQFPQTHFFIPPQRLTTQSWALKSDIEASTFAKLLRLGQPLGDYINKKMYRGVTTGLNDAFVIDEATRERLIAEDRRSSQVIKRFVSGEDVRRWHVEQTDLWLIFPRRGIDINEYPAIRKHLDRWRNELTPKKGGESVGRKPGKYKWYEIQDNVAYFRAFDVPKIIFPDICKNPRFTLDVTGAYLGNTAYCIPINDPYLLGLLNSQLFWFSISNVSIPFGIRAGQYRYRLIYQYMEKIPIRVCNSSDRRDKAFHDKMVSLVQRMLDLHKRLQGAKAAHERTVIERQIAATDEEIDHLVYELYDLTKDEIAIIETGVSDS